MGILIIGFLLIAAGAFIAAIAFAVWALAKKETGVPQAVAGLLVSGALYGILWLDYTTSSAVWALGAYFAFPSYMVLLPCKTGTALRFMPGTRMKAAGHALVFCAVFSGLFIVIFQDNTVGIAELYGLQKQY